MPAPVDEMDTAALIRALPKLDQHVHIVGSTRPETLLWMIEDSGAESPLNNLEDVKGFYRYTDFDHFIRVYSAVNDVVTDEAYYELITYELLESEAACGVRHVEAIFSPNDHVRRGLSYGRILDSINSGVRRGSRDFGVTCTLRADLVRNYGPETGRRVLGWIGGKGENVSAIDLGGSERGYPPGPYAGVYAEAKRMGLRLDAHAGEAAGPESVRGAVEALGVERIGHGTTAVKDHALLREIKSRGITIEACPTSNLRIGAIKSIKEHPIRHFMKHGINVTINSDDPPMFNTDINNEYLQLHNEQGFSVDELMRISLDSVETSFLPRKKKDELRVEFLKEYRELKN